jgi:flavin-dependent dehydrogenase
MFDLTIIGAGPAGTSAAITAARAGARVLLLERGVFPRHKVCGEFVSPESLHILRSLLPRSTLLHHAPQIANARLFVDNRMLATAIHPPAASVARLDLDACLFHTAQQSGVEARQQTTATSIQGHGPFQISSTEQTFHTRAIINASGRWSNFTTGSANGNHRPKWLGLKAHFAESDPAPSVDLYFFDGGYCGVQPVALRSVALQSELEPSPNTRINVCAMVRADVAATLPEVFQKNSVLRDRSRNWQALIQPVTTSPLIFRRPQPTDGNILLAGDAAAFVDPFIGDGISLGLRSGTLAAHSLLPFFQDKITLPEAAAAYRKTYQEELLPVFKTSSKIRHLFSLPKMFRVPLMLFFQHTPALTQYLLQKTR